MGQSLTKIEDGKEILYTLSGNSYLFSKNSKYIPHIPNPCNHPIILKSIGWSFSCLSDTNIPSLLDNDKKIPLDFEIVPLRFNKYYYLNGKQTNKLIDKYSGGNLSRVTYFGSNDNTNIDSEIESINIKDSRINFFNQHPELRIKPYRVTTNPFIRDSMLDTITTKNIIINPGDSIGIYIRSCNNTTESYTDKDNKNYQYDNLIGLTVTLYLEKY